MPTNKPKYIIAIGASAGGLEDLNAFFDHTPLDSVSYVIVQHLSPDYKSSMVALLSKHSKLTVQEVKNGMAIKGNEVYLIPNNKFMTIRNNTFYLTDKEKVPGPHLTINAFFISLAANSGSKAIGVILSGLGSDGTEGAKAIKKAGGMLIARNPETTEFNSMPSNAIATGLIDFILEPEAMPGTIEDYTKHEGGLLADNADDEKHLTAIVDFIKTQLPLDFTEYKQSTILRRIKRRADFNNFTNLSGYFDFLKATPEEVENLAQDFLISVTSFFRDKEAFDHIEKEILPVILKTLAPEEELKMWVAGCATGEEAYALAILICEQLTLQSAKTIVKIFATDIDKIALAFAKKGIYNAAAIKNVSAVRLEKHFLKEGENYKIKPEIRKMVVFAQHDLVKNPPYCNMHLISCRNLLIYMTPALQKKIFLMLQFGLKKDGYLFLGSSENPLSIIQNLEVVNKKWKIYKNVETKRTISFDAFSLPSIEDTKYAPLVLSKERPAQNTSHTLPEAVNISLANVLDCLIVCINQNNQVVKTYGDTTKFLLQKNFTLNLAGLLPRQLAIAFNTLLKKVIQTNENAAVSGIQINRDGATIKVNLSVSPLTSKKDGQKLWMATFTEDKSVAWAQEEKMAFDEKEQLDEYTLNLEEELKELKETLQSLQEKLDASNENLQSFNEELLSSNEEMQSTNEEMQSINEELHTINSDYQSKNKELQELNDDLNNYFRSNINGQLFINHDLLLMKFSPGTVKLINLRETDIGRPLSHISTNIKFETITADIETVLAQGSIITKEIETTEGKWYQLTTMPYLRQEDNKINGAILTFNDVTELKKTQQDLDKKNKRLLRINEDLDHFVHAASHDLLAPLSNIEGSISVMNLIKVDNPNLKEFLDIINLSVVKFRALVKDLATIGRLENDINEMERVDIDELIDNIEWSLDNKIKSSGVVINRDLELKRLLFSRKNLRSIVYNLISNGIKFRRDDEHTIINIRTAKEGDDIVLTVEDNGRGIPKDSINKIFELYGRLHQEVEGQGIGLYLSKKMVNQTGGTITVESEPGKGSKFIIRLNAEHTFD